MGRGVIDAVGDNNGHVHFELIDHVRWGFNDEQLQLTSEVKLTKGSITTGYQVLSYFTSNVILQSQSTVRGFTQEQMGINIEYIQKIP